MLSTNQKITTRSLLLDLLGMFVLLGVFYAIWIGSHALFTPDESRYSEVAREMVATGDYVTPRLNGVAFLDKPVFYYWLQASAIKLYGIQEWALRFWPACIGVLGCVITYLTGRVIFNRRTGIVSGLILATCPLYYGAAHYANLDLEVAVLIGNCLLFFLMATKLSEGKLRSFALLLSYMFAGLAFLTKGLIGIVFPGIIVGLWILSLNKWALLKNIHLVVGIILFFCIASPWYILAQQANPEFLHFFFITQQVTRFLTKADFNNKSAWWFYFPIVLAGIFPWSIFVIQAISSSIKKCWKNRSENTSLLFLLIWLVFVFAFFSFPKSKTVGYILPIFPPLALLIGYYLDQAWERTKAKGIVVALLSFSLISLITAGVFFYYIHTKGLGITDSFIPLLKINIILFSFSGLAVLYFLRNTTLKKLFSFLLIFSSLFLLIISASTPHINQRSIKPLIVQLNTVLKPSDELVTYYKFYYDLPIYTGKRITIVADWNAPDIEQNDNWLRELWYGMPFQNTKTWLINDDVFWKRWNGPKRMFVFTDASNYTALQKKAKQKFYKVANYKNVIVVTNEK